MTKLQKKGIFLLQLNKESEEIVWEQIKPSHDLVKQELHVTIAFNVSLDEIDPKLIGETGTFAGQEVLSNDKIQALFGFSHQIDNITNKATRKHVALSHTAGTPPKLSKELPKDPTTNKIILEIPLILSGVFAWNQLK